jgi:spore maturation protein CgeB
MRWLLSEDWTTDIYAEPFFQRLAGLGEEVHAFKEGAFYQINESKNRLRATGSRWVRAQHRLRLGPRIARLNLTLLQTVENVKPNVLFLFRGDQVWPATLAAVKQRGVYVVGWHNDNPFSPAYPWYVWRHFRLSIPIYDRLYAYRTSNVEDFSRAGCGRTGQLRSFYVRERNYPIQASPDPGFTSEVSFCGHWEPDGRDDYIAALLNTQGVDFRLWGTLWERSGLSCRLMHRFGPITPLYKERYNAALNGTKIGLVFLSGLNRDTYTRRCFEIPAAGTFMLAQYTADLAAMFAEGVEAEYFRSPVEMVGKIRYFLNNEAARVRIAAAGRERLLRDGHEAMDRARQVYDDVRRDIG